MDTDIRTFMIKARMADRTREAADERLAREARTCRVILHGATPAHHRHGLLRVGLAAGFLGLAVALARPAAAGAGLPGASALFDPWAPLAAAVEQSTTIRWDCVGLPRPSAPVPTPATGNPVAGTASCTGLACRWDLDDPRLDGAVAMREADRCPDAVSSSRSAPCLGGPAWLVGAVGGWAGSWTSSGTGDRLIVMAGTGAFAGLMFVGHWVDPGADAGWVTGLLTRDRRPVMLLWPVPFL